MKPRINEYSWEGINFPSEKDNWKKFEKNNVTTALNVLYTKKLRKTSNSFIHSKRGKIALPCSKVMIIIIKRSNIKK